MQPDEVTQLDYVFSLRIKKDEVFFGPGTSELLLLLEKTGSLHKAAECMGMSYSKAWKIIKFAEEKIGYKLTTRKVGGVGGGGSVLTQEGKAFLEAYETFKREAKIQMDALFNKYFSEVI